MSFLLTRSADAEVLELGASTLTLLADAAGTGGTLNANRTVLEPGTAGPPPHFHNDSAEMFFVLGGWLRALAGDRIVTLEEGDSCWRPSGCPTPSPRRTR